jgi:glycosyltransferase involved in cell wall biosynthesis
METAGFCEVEPAVDTLACGPGRKTPLNALVHSSPATSQESAKYAVESRQVRPRGVARPLRVLHYLFGDTRAGIEEHALSLLAALSAEGSCAYLAATPALLAKLERETTQHKIRTAAIRRAAAWDFRDAVRFVRYLRREKIEVVHSHLFIGSMFASPLARAAGVPAIVETYHLRESWREAKALKSSFWPDRQVGRFVDAYIAVSTATAQHLIDIKKIARAKVETIRNGRDLERFHPISAAERDRTRRRLGVDKGPVLLLLGRLEEQKGHTFAIEAVRQIRDKHPGISLLFAGTGRLDSPLKAQCEEAGLEGVVRFLGYRDDPELLLGAADIMLLPSLNEGLPLSIVEAMACAIPVVATDIEGTRELVLDGKTGLLVPTADSGLLASALDRLLCDRSHREWLGSNGRKHVEDHFDVRSQVAKTRQVYSKLLGI